ncbi:hypothetical protein DFS34DRAFT_683063 [Phlyctochytrium arcticum]|nr:hypothetical protein DFS34DRAFT_683063 [Phlyctochytrium arcticum]
MLLISYGLATLCLVQAVTALALTPEVNQQSWTQVHVSPGDWFWMDPQCSPESMANGLWPKCGASGCNASITRSSLIWESVDCAGYRVTITAAYNGWEYRNAFLSALIAGMANAKQEGVRNYCTGHADGRECFEKKGWKVPRKMKLQRYVENSVQAGEMMLQYSSPHESNALCAFIIEFVKAAISTVGAGSAAATAVLLPTDAICNAPSELLPADDLWNDPKWDTILEDVRRSFNTTEEV